MTDNEIINALEICSSDAFNDSKERCTGCKYDGADKNLFCFEVLEKDALDLIKRQKEEIETYKKLYEDLKAENLEIIKAIKHCRADAVKEFAKTLKSHYDNYGDYEDIYVHHIRDDIDFLIEEMTEDGEEDA